MSCLIVTSVIKELANKLSEETEQSVLGLVSLWQESNNKSLEEYPTIEELLEFRNKLRHSSTVSNDKNFYREKITTSEQAQVDFDFDPQIRRDRVSLISRLFSNVIDNYIKENPNLSRIETIKALTPNGIFNNIINIFKSYILQPEDAIIQAELQQINNSKGANKYSEEQKINAANNKAKYKKQEYIKILRNFRALAEESCTNLLTTESIAVNFNSIMPSSPNLNEQDAYGYSTLDKLSEDWTLEENIKEGWMSNFRQVSSHESLSQEVRKVISKIPKLNNIGKYEKDDLGFTRYLDANYVHATLIDKLSSMITSEDMIPLLEDLSNSKPWVKQIIKLLNSNDKLFSQFYQDFRKDFVSYWIQKKSYNTDGSFTMKTICVNKPEGISFLLDSWRDNHEYSIKLDDNIIYGNDDNLNIKNTKEGLNLIEVLNNKFSNLDSKSRIQLLSDDIVWNNIIKSLHMIGVDSNPSIIKAALTNIKNSDSIHYTDPIMLLLPQLYIIFKGVSTNKFKVDNNKIDLINHFDSAYTIIASLLSEVTEDAIESSIRENDKSYYSHVTPNYLGKLIKQLKNSNNDFSRFSKFINEEFKQYEWFFKNGKWRNDWIKQIVESEEIRKGLSHKIVLNSDKIEYSNWDNLDYTIVLLSEYWSELENTKSNIKWAWYHIPILSDSPSAEFIRFRKYVSDIEYDEFGNRLNYEDIITEKLISLVNQEYDRIQLVLARDEEYQKNNFNVSPIANFDIIRDKKGNIKNIGGAEFKFLPALNFYRDTDGNLFIDNLRNLIQNNSGEDIKNYIKDAIINIMESGFQEAYNNWNNIGLFEKLKNGNYKYLPKKFSNETKVKEALKEYYWNSKLATSQIIQLTTTDLAFYKNIEDFQKRYKEIHAPSLRMNTKAIYNGELVGREIERTVYLKDDEIISNSLNDIKEILDYKVSIGELSISDRNNIIAKFNEVNVADAQAYRSLSSYKSVLVMSGQWTDEMESAYKNFINNTWDIKDFDIIWQTKKPYVYTQINNSSGIDGHTGIKTPVQHKNSEFLLLAMHLVASGVLGKSQKLRAINEFMEENAIDVVQFESTTKVGKQGVIDINNIKDFKQVKSVLQNAVKPNGIENPNVVHKISYEDYGIQTPTPEHVIDTVQLVGTQIRKLITADISSDSIIEVNGKKLTKEEWLDLYNKVNTENIIQAFEEINSIFKNPKEVERIIHEEIRKNQRYGIEHLKACTLNENNEFNIPLYDPIISQDIQTLLNSIIKNNITKQKIKGGALIQTSNYGLSDDLKIVFEGEGKNKRIKYLECYMPAYSKSFYSTLLKTGTHELNIDRLPEELRRLIGYRVPTENKYSMVPLRIKGFLPQHNGSSIMLPSEITTLSGSDFDVDKLYVMLPEFDIIEYDYKKAKQDFIKERNTINELQTLFNTNNILEDLNKVPETFKEWFNSNKDRYKLEYPKLQKVQYDFKKEPKDNRLEARNNLLIDMMWGILTNPDTASKVLNPGNFDYQKKAARIVNILSNINENTLRKELNIEGDIINKLISMDLKSLNKLIESNKISLDPISPTTQVYLHQQNMTGAKLIGIYANHNANHALMQHTNLSISDNSSFILNGKRLVSLHSILNSEKEFISTNTAGFLAASVDNVKDPVLANINQNIFTADSAMLLSRLGYNPIEIGLLLTQPIIMDITKSYFRESREGKNKEFIINDIIQDYLLKSNLTLDEADTLFKAEKFLLEDLAKNIISYHSSDINSVFYKKQVFIGLLFSKIIKTSDALGQLVQATRSDTQGGAAGPTIADTEIKIQKINDFIRDSKNIYFPLINCNVIKSLPINSIESLREELYNSPLPFLQAFYTLGLEKSRSMLNNYFPHFNNSFTSVIEDLRNMTRNGRLNVKTMNSIYNDLISYIMSGISFFGAESSNDGKIITSKEKRDYFINSFPSDFIKIVNNNEDIANLEFIKRLRVIKSNSNNPIDTLVFKNVGKLSSILKERYIRDWASLLYMNNPKANKLALDLFRYSFYRNGFAFGPNTFIHLAPIAVRIAIPEYINTLRDIKDSSISYKEFIHQYIYNHLDNRQLVPEIDNNSSVDIIDSNNNIKNIISFNINYDSNSSDRKIIKEKKSTPAGDIYDFFEFITKKVNGEYIYYQLFSKFDNKVSYERIYPLGQTNHFIEYEYGKDVKHIKSSINKNIKVENLNSSTISIESSNFNDDYSGSVKFEETTSDEVLDYAFKAIYGKSFIEENNDNNITSIEPNTQYTDENGEVICGTSF